MSRNAKGQAGDLAPAAELTAAIDRPSATVCPDVNSTHRCAGCGAGGGLPTIERPRGKRSSVWQPGVQRQAVKLTLATLNGRFVVVCAECKERIALERRAGR
jgi:hypothetical protein